MEIDSKGLVRETVLFDYGLERVDGMLLEFVDDVLGGVVVESPVPVFFPVVSGFGNRLSQIRITNNVIGIDIIIILGESTFGNNRLNLVFESESGIIVTILLWLSLFIIASKTIRRGCPVQRLSRQSFGDYSIGEIGVV